MPGGDKTGPLGAGAMTGRGMGYCSGNDQPGFANIGFGRGRGFGRGLGMGAGRGFGRGFGMGAGHGWRNRFYATGIPGRASAGRYPYAYDYEAYPEPAPSRQYTNDELSYLKEESKNLHNALDEISKRIEELEKK